MPLLHEEQILCRSLMNFQRPEKNLSGVHKAQLDHDLGPSIFSDLSKQDVQKIGEFGSRKKSIRGVQNEPFIVNAPDRKLRTTLYKAEKQINLATRRIIRAKTLDAEPTGFLEPEKEAEKTYILRQESIAECIDHESARKYFHLKLPTYGPYYMTYSPNGNFLALVGHRGHLATIRWKNFKLHGERQLGENCRAIHFLHDQQFFAVAQQKYTHVYTYKGIEVHRLREMTHACCLEFLPQHFLLCSGNKSGLLTWFDISTGKLSGLRHSRLGEIQCMQRDPSTNILSVGHPHGHMTLWSPKMANPLLRHKCHQGSISDLAWDEKGTYFYTSGRDDYVRVWDMRTFRSLHQVHAEHASTIDLSYNNLLAVGTGSRIEVWKNLTAAEHPYKPYMVHNFEQALTYTQHLEFCPFEDVLGVGHSNGFSSLLIPGAGCAVPDFYRANPFETRKQMKERAVQNLLDKLPADTIMLQNISEVKNAKLGRQYLSNQPHDHFKPQEGFREDNKNTSESDNEISKTDTKRIRRFNAQLCEEELERHSRRLKRQQRRERWLNRLEGVQKYKLKQRTQGRKQVRAARQRLKPKNHGT